MASFLLSRLLLPFFFLCNILPSHALGSAPAGFSAGLIHRDSLVSPLRAAVSMPYSRVHAAIHRSRDRAKYVNKVVSSSRSREVNFSSVITTATFEYLMRFQLGTPGREAFALPDTGSDLIWVQCKPCHGCSGPSYSLFDPNLSSTYKSVPCNAKSCSWLGDNFCDMNSSCRYNYSYVDGTGVSGLLSTETLVFPSVDNQTEVQLPETLFGCTTEAKSENSTGFVGVFGLSMGHLSLISQLGSSVDYKFSYCLPSFPITDDDGENASGRLDFGSMAKVFDSGAASTPIISNDNFFYFLNLESISVNGGKHIIIKPSKDEHRGTSSSTPAPLSLSSTVRQLLPWLWPWHASFAFHCRTTRTWMLK
ncbi:hypothetical protein HPP92_025530 [Vanilla planifolia]|uniref:Peptidase A1 domain-containing protein n=1 Tax=Vanilla planifolia TaxID=51239 RepID=A0A835UCF4_VANPL|nr:hypothetical protein HPP92_025530 [Vanilla planifolia]